MTDADKNIPSMNPVFPLINFIALSFLLLYTAGPWIIGLLDYWIVANQRVMQKLPYGENPKCLF
jgi:hypothetical protein